MNLYRQESDMPRKSFTPEQIIAKLRQIERRAMSRLKYELAARGVMTSKMH